METKQFKFKSLEARKKFKSAGKTNQFILDNYFKIGILNLSFTELLNAPQRGFINHFIDKDGNEVIDDINVIDIDEFTELFEEKPESKSKVGSPEKGVLDEDLLFQHISRELGTEPLQKSQEPFKSSVLIEAPLKPINWSLEKAIMEMVLREYKTAGDMDIRITIKNGKVEYSVKL
ncbi:hypothetical protein ZPAH1_orf00334 [Aeromonas phage ZPAH1]|nr:hypothetical protein ASwh1_288 [Aeromonas phage Aswh_1]QQG34096.1 hypothetical protein ZPAH1_orf00334 [Aeromonas phage ZPAH1]